MYFKWLFPVDVCCCPKEELLRGEFKGTKEVSVESDGNERKQLCGAEMTSEATDACVERSLG